MKKFERLDEAVAPDGNVLTLYRHDGNYFIRINGVELMSTRRHYSEDQLAELVCAPLQSVPRARVLIGGLGFGFTLRAALRTLAADAEVVVAELVPGVVAWNANADYDLAGSALRDARVEIRQSDVARVMSSSPAAFDAIMLDVDNGADALTTAGNARLYGETGVFLAISALRPHGQLAYWSAVAEPAFGERLRRTGLSVSVTTSRAHRTSGPSHFIYVATLPR